MKKNIHPKYYHNTKVTCSCGNVFVTGSVLQEITTELCSNCHPFYTGEQRIVDTENLVSKYMEREKAKKSFKTKKEKLLMRKQKFSDSQKKPASTLTLKDLLSQIGK